MRTIVIGLLAHVDSGKTTLSEAMLVQGGICRDSGNVNQGSTLLDYDAQERARGITIYSKEAYFPWHDAEIVLLDTPGHVDFAAEMERTLPILDAAVLILSATAGVQAHTLTIWRLLKHYHIPVFVFVNKMDAAHKTKAELLHALSDALHVHCVDFHLDKPQLDEEAAMGSDVLLEEYMNQGAITKESLIQAIQEQQFLPCWFGAALHGQGVCELLEGIYNYTKQTVYPSELGVRVYKISHGADSSRLTHVRVIGGSLNSKQILLDEKIDQLRRYQGPRYIVTPTLSAGQIGVIQGVQHLRSGMTLGQAEQMKQTFLATNMTYRMVCEEVDAHTLMKHIRVLEEEDPTLHLSYDARWQEVILHLRGAVQMEVLTQVIADRFHFTVRFEPGRIAYRESIVSAVEGVGHYEPLRHYAEVHLRLLPGKRDSGLCIDADCPTDLVDLSTQRMIVEYLKQETLVGVLSGSPLTDMRITLIAAKAHPKHTSGGDFREAAQRALRQGLMMSESILLEPYVYFQMHVPHLHISKVIFDLDQANGEYILDQAHASYTMISGHAPLKALRTYAQTLAADTKGKGVLHMEADGYREVVKPTAILKELGYDPQRDMDHPSGSIFCEHGAGVYIPWDEVYAHMHLPLLMPTKETQPQPLNVHRQITIDDAELKRVTSTLHQPRPKYRNKERIRVSVETKTKETLVSTQKRPCLIVDGYNMIFAWPDLAQLAEQSLEHARSELISRLHNYQGFRRCLIIVVFDAYRREQNKEQIYKEHHLYIVFTKASQTADSYIEKTTHTLANQYQIQVATSDAQEQNIILGAGAMRMSAKELLKEMEHFHHQTLNSLVYQPRFQHMALSDLRKWNEVHDEDDE